MSDYITFCVPMVDVTREISSCLGEFFNGMGERSSLQLDGGGFLKTMSRDLDDDGRAFLQALALYVMQEFPPEHFVRNRKAELLTAVEFGFKKAEAGNNIEAALCDAHLVFLHGGKKPRDKA